MNCRNRDLPSTTMPIPRAYESFEFYLNAVEMEDNLELALSLRHQAF